MEPEPTTEILNGSSQPLAACMSKPEPEPALEKVNACSQPLTTEISGTSKSEAELVPEKVDACSHPLAAGAKPHLFYKCLLNQHAQKLRKESPIYRTYNEGVDHLPKFRSTVWIDGVSYTSSNTYQQRKMAEMDVSKMAYSAIMQKSKNEALHLIRQDKIFCKSILVEYAAKMTIEKPTYDTIQLGGTLMPTFRSSLVFNGVTYSGDGGKSKKEAEQLAARAVILKYLESESGNDMSEIINCKFRHYAEMHKAQEINSVHTDTSVVGAQTGVNDAIDLNKAVAESGTSTMLESCVGPEVSLVQGTAVPPQVSIQAITSAVPGPAVLTQTPSAAINNSSPGIIPPPFPLASQAPDYLPLIGQTSERKRSRKSKKNAQKKMRVDAQMPIPALPPCSSQ